jgi:hypothetical protein
MGESSGHTVLTILDDSQKRRELLTWWLYWHWKQWYRRLPKASKDWSTRPCYFIQKWILTIFWAKQFGWGPIMLRGGVRWMLVYQVGTKIPNSGVRLYKAGIWGCLCGCSWSNVLSARKPFFIRTYNK